jgi:hypothetical protein
MEADCLPWVATRLTQIAYRVDLSWQMTRRNPS